MTLSYIEKIILCTHPLVEFIVHRSIIMMQKKGKETRISVLEDIDNRTAWAAGYWTSFGY